MIKAITDKRIILICSISAILLSVLSACACAQSLNRQANTASNECEWKISISVPATKPDGRPHDGLSDFDPATIARVAKSLLPSFLKDEAPPDVALFLVTPDSGIAVLIGQSVNDCDANYVVKQMPPVFALFALDLDGDGFPISEGQYHDYLGGAIFTIGPARVTPELRRQLVNRLHRAIRRAGAQSLEYQTQLRLTDSQIPRDFPIVSLQQCAATELRPDGSEGVLFRFTPSAKKEVARH